jgi:hypothetical protein
MEPYPENKDIVAQIELKLNKPNKENLKGILSFGFEINTPTSSFEKYEDAQPPIPKNKATDGATFPNKNFLIAYSFCKEK